MAGASHVVLSVHEENTADLSARGPRLVRKLANKWKCLYVVLQTMCALPLAINMPIPPAFYTLISVLNLSNFMVPGNCLQLRRYSLYDHLVLCTVGPLAVCTAIVPLNFMKNVRRTSQSSSGEIERIERPQSRRFFHLVFEHRVVRFVGRRISSGDSRPLTHYKLVDVEIVVAGAVLIGFFSYPPSAFAVVSFFATLTFDDPQKPGKRLTYAKFDLKLTTTGSVYAAWRIYASLCVASHVVGFPAICWSALFRARFNLDPTVEGAKLRIDPGNLALTRRNVQTLANRRFNDRNLWRTRSLWGVYSPQWYYWECLELIRRTTIIAVPMLCGRTPTGSALYAISIAGLSTRLYNSIEPFLEPSDNHLYQAMQWLTLVLAFLIFIVVVGVGEGSRDMDYALISVIVVTVGTCGFFVIRESNSEELALKILKTKIAATRSRRVATSKCYAPTVCVVAQTQDVPKVNNKETKE